MADATFQVDILLNMINKATGQVFSSLETSTKSIDKNIRNVSDAISNTLNKGVKDSSYYFDRIKSTTEKTITPTEWLNSGIRAIDNNLKETVKQTDVVSKNFVDISSLVDKTFKKGIKDSNYYLSKIPNTTKKIVTPLDLANEVLDKSTKKIQKMSDLMKPSEFGFLSMIFGGMALQRVFGGVFKSLRDTYTKVADQNDLFIKKVDQLSGAFQYLGFSIYSGFAENEFVQTIISSITESLINLGNFFDDHPNLSTLITSLVGALALFGTILFAQGTIISIGKGLSELLGITSLSGLLTSFGASSFMISAITEGLDFTITLALAGILFTSAIEDILSATSDLKTDWNKALFGILKSTFAGAWIGSKFGVSGAIIGATIGFTFGISLTFFSKFANEFLNSEEQMTSTKDSLDEVSDATEGLIPPISEVTSYMSDFLDIILGTKTKQENLITSTYDLQTGQSTLATSLDTTLIPSVSNSTSYMNDFADSCDRAYSSLKKLKSLSSGVSTNSTGIIKSAVGYSTMS